MAEPEQSYNGPLALSKEKCNDIKVLLKFCEEEGSKEYYMNLLVGNETAIEVPAVDVATHETAEANF